MANESVFSSLSENVVLVQKAAAGASAPRLYPTSDSTRIKRKLCLILTQPSPAASHLEQIRERLFIYVHKGQFTPFSTSRHRDRFCYNPKFLLNRTIHGSSAGTSCRGNECTHRRSHFCSSPLSASLYRLLLELLELLFDKFKAVAQAHSVVLAHLQRIAAQCPAGAHEEGIKLYELADVSAKIQAVLQVSSNHSQQFSTHCTFPSSWVRCSSDRQSLKKQKATKLLWPKDDHINNNRENG